MSSMTEPDVFQRCGLDILPPHVIALIRERQRRLAAISRYERYVAQAAGHLTLQGFWRNLKRQDMEDARRLEEWLDREIRDCVPSKSDIPPRVTGPISMAPRR